MLICLHWLSIVSQILALIIITLPVYFKVNALLKSWPINGGIIAAGVFLLLVAIAGIYGAWRQHQIILFFVSFHKERLATLDFNARFFQPCLASWL